MASSAERLATSISLSSFAKAAELKKTLCVAPTEVPPNTARTRSAFVWSTTTSVHARVGSGAPVLSAHGLVAPPSSLRMIFPADVAAYTRLESDRATAGYTARGSWSPRRTSAAR